MNNKTNPTSQKLSAGESYYTAAVQKLKKEYEEARTILQQAEVTAQEAKKKLHELDGAYNFLITNKDIIQAGAEKRKVEEEDDTTAV